MSNAGLIIIGDEILSGKVVDTNGPFLIKELRDLGVSLLRISTIPDQVSEIAATVREFSSRFDLVFTSGGIGPTHDDVTLPGVALAFERRLERPKDLEARLAIRSIENPLPLTPHSFRLIEVPTGTVLLKTEPSLWPVFQVKNVYIFPGVPELFCRKFLAIRELFRENPFFLKEIYVTVHEEQIAAHLDQVVNKFPQVMVGSYPRLQPGKNGYLVRLTLEGKDRSSLEQAYAELTQRLGEVIISHKT